MFKECFAMEKIHGTSAHISWGNEENKSSLRPLRFFAGGVKYDNFVALFNQEELTKKFEELDINSIIVYGEAYGGKCQGMSEIYGKALTFVVFDVKINDTWLAVPNAHKIAEFLSLEFVAYKRIPTLLAEIDKERDMDSVQAIRNKMGAGHKREGIVLRPIIELKKNNGARIIVKHKNEEFQETKTKREITDPDKLKVLEDAKAIAEEWVTPMRLSNVMSKIPDIDITKMGDIIKAMIEDVEREAKGEIMESKQVRKQIGKKTALMAKEHFKSKLDLFRKDK